MNTLAQQKIRLETEIIAAKQSIVALKECAITDFKTINHHAETIERNMQLISMIDNHLNSGHQPMWRKR